MYNVHVHVHVHVHTCSMLLYMYMYMYYGMPNVPKTLTNAIFVYPPLIYKYDTDLAKYLPDLYKSGSDL